MCVSCKGGLVKKRRKSGKTGIVGQTAEQYPMEDRVLKAAARFMGEELLPLLGVEGVVKRVAPTEAVFLEVKDFLADFNYEMADGTWKRLEFESDSISAEDLRRFRAWEAVVSYQYKTEVSTCVLCSSEAQVLRDSLTEGMNTYRVQIVRMKDRNADRMIEELEEKQRKEALDREELLNVLLTLLMGGEMSRKERVERSFGILGREEERVGREEMARMQSVLYALAMKFLAVEEVKEIKEMMAMTLMGQMLMEDGIAKGIKRGIEQGIEQGLERGIEQGIEQGEFKTLLSLIEDGFLTKKEAAARKGMTVEQFQGKLMELKLI